jgi:hypothetical protein
MRVRIIEKYLGLSGSPFVWTRRLKAWGQGESGSLIWLCWRNGVGGWCWIKKVSDLESWPPDMVYRGGGYKLGARGIGVVEGYS